LYITYCYITSQETVEIIFQVEIAIFHIRQSGRIIKIGFFDEAEFAPGAKAEKRAS
jgi:hypothetical protein